MLASTIQFSKYGQDNQPQTTTCQYKHPNQGNNTPNPDTHTNRLVRAGPSHHTNQSPGQSVTQKKQSQDPYRSRARFLRTQQRASAIHSATPRSTPTSEQY
jgi:hypothetical protein